MNLCASWLTKDTISYPILFCFFYNTVESIIPSTVIKGSKAICLCKNMSWSSQNMQAYDAGVGPQWSHEGSISGNILGFCLDQCKPCIILNCRRPCLAHTEDV